MARSEDTLMTLLLLGGVGYLAYHYLYLPSQVANVTPPLAPGQVAPPAAVGSIMCKFPDGTMVPTNPDGTCPFDTSHQGQSTPCAGPGFVGPLQPGMSNC
jgi:hypothetical protein